MTSAGTAPWAWLYCSIHVTTCRPRVCLCLCTSVADDDDDDDDDVPLKGPARAISSRAPSVRPDGATPPAGAGAGAGSSNPFTPDSDGDDDDDNTTVASTVVSSAVATLRVALAGPKGGPDGNRTPGNAASVTAALASAKERETRMTEELHRLVLHMSGGAVAVAVAVLCVRCGWRCSEAQ